jgi:hypothetical protein
LPDGAIVVLAGAGVAVGAIARVAPAFTSDFPIGDGGLFVVMARDLAANGFVPPLTTTYNGAGIPYAYPPFGLYVLAIIGDPIATMRWLGPVLSLACIGAVYLVGAQWFGRTGGLIACAAYAVAPRAFPWLISGGGSIRALGLLFALLAAWQVRRSPTRAGILVGAAILTHPEAGAFAVLGLVVLGLDHPRSLLRAGFVAGFVVLPWAILMMTRIGLGPYVDALLSRQPGGVGSFVGVVRVAPAIGVAALPAAVIAIRGRRWALLAWPLATVVLVQAPALTYVPALLALLVAYAAVQQRAAMVTAALAIALTIPFTFGGPAAAHVRTLSTHERQMLAALPAGSTVTIAPVDPIWELDVPNEWLPALSGARSALVVQGYEWTRDWSYRLARWQSARQAAVRHP